MPQELYSAVQIRELDRCTAIELGLSAGGLMERAGEAAWFLLRERWPRARRVAVICGPGNNGGDGYVLARHAREAGLAVTTLVVTPAAPQGDASFAYNAFVAAGLSVQPFTPELLGEADVVVDGLFGTGLGRPIDGMWRTAIEAINAAHRPILALDIPSGLHADSGSILGAAVRADVTLTFVGLKAGLFTGRGPDVCGDVAFDDLGMPPHCNARLAPIGNRLTRANLHGLLTARPQTLHKGQAGRVLILGGNRGMGGAAQLAGEAAYRVGAGLVTVGAHALHAGAMSSVSHELLARPIATAADARMVIGQGEIVGVGPGLGQDDWAQMLWGAALDSGRSLVVDADALNLLALEPLSRDDWILTPHPGEAARLLGTHIADIQANRVAVARDIARRFGGICVLKGAGTVVTKADEEAFWLCDRGNPGMATGGMGDVLTGVIAGLRAQGLSPLEAARLGVWVHATAGDAAAGEGGEIGLMAGDLLPHVRSQLNCLVDR